MNRNRSANDRHESFLLFYVFVLFFRKRELFWYASITWEICATCYHNSGVTSSRFDFFFFLFENFFALCLLQVVFFCLLLLCITTKHSPVIAYTTYSLLRLFTRYSWGACIEDTAPQAQLTHTHTVWTRQRIKYTTGQSQIVPKEINRSCDLKKLPLWNEIVDRCRNLIGKK